MSKTSSATESWSFGDKELGDAGGEWIEIDAPKALGFAKVVWRMEDDERSPECEARAHVLLAAPNMLRMLQELVKAGSIWPDLLPKVNAVIAEAMPAPIAKAIPAPISRKVIRTDGTEELLDKPVTIEQIKKLINTNTLDTVSLRDAGHHVMLVDDLGYQKNLPVNETATRLYWSICVPGTTHQILGDVVIVPDADFGGPL